MAVLILSGMVLASAFTQLSAAKTVQFQDGKKQISIGMKIIPKRTLMMVSTSVAADDADEKVCVAIADPAASTTGISRRRKISRVEKFARLPVWPVWNGVAIFIISQIFGNEIAAKLEGAIGGRVCPNFFAEGETSPFIMLVHHRHSFARFDILRYIQRTFFPEGFPSHPHRGFTTVTYILKGGFLHRDSTGIKQSYGAEKKTQGEAYTMVKNRCRHVA